MEADTRWWFFISQPFRDSVRALELEAGKRNIISTKCDFLLPPAAAKVALVVERSQDTGTKAPSVSAL